MRKLFFLILLNTLPVIAFARITPGEFYCPYSTPEMIETVSQERNFNLVQENLLTQWITAPENNPCDQQICRRLIGDPDKCKELVTTMIDQFIENTFKDRHLCTTTYNINERGDITAQTDSPEISESFKSTGTYDDDGFVTLSLLLNLIEKNLESRSSFDAAQPHDIKPEYFKLLIEAIERQSQYWQPYSNDPRYSHLKTMIDDHINIADYLLPLLKERMQNHQPQLRVSEIYDLFEFQKKYIDDHGYEARSLSNSGVEPSRYGLCDDFMQPRCCSEKYFPANNIFAQSICAQGPKKDQASNFFRGEKSLCYHHEVSLSSDTIERLIPSGSKHSPSQSPQQVESR